MELIINESQFELIQSLLEGDSPMLNGGNVKKYGNPSEVGTSAVVTDADGDPKPGEDVTSDEFGQTQSNQETWRIGRRFRFYN